MFCENDCGPQFPVNAGKHLKKLPGCQRIQLTGGLVQQQHLRLHNHDGGQVQHLLLSPGQFRRRTIKPALHTEKSRHLRHPPLHHIIWQAEIFQAERQLVPDHVRHNGLRRILLHETDLGGADEIVHLGNLRSHIYHAPGKISAGNQILLHHPKQRALAAAGRTADQIKTALRKRKIDFLQSRPLPQGIGKTHIFKGQNVHLLPPCASIASASKKLLPDKVKVPDTRHSRPRSAMTEGAARASDNNRPSSPAEAQP